MTTNRLYQHDSYLTEFTAHIVKRSQDGRRIYLDRSAFYPTSGGQPHDTGEIAGARVVDVIDEEHHIAHIMSEPVEAVEVTCRIDWPRRFDHMQQHSGQHLLSAVFLELFSAPTVAFHLGEEISTIELETPSLEPDQLEAAEREANRIAAQNRPVTISFEDSSTVQGLRRPPERSGTLRIVTIDGLDRSACGGTHVRATGEIGPILLRRTEKIRGHVRVEFLCGLRAVACARKDFRLLAQAAAQLSCRPEQLPELVAAQREALLAADKRSRRLAVELAALKGRQAYAEASPEPSGVRRLIERRAGGSIDEELRSLALSFTEQPSAIFTAAIENPPSVLLAVSADLGIHAGETLKKLLSRFGARGGGNARLAQGSLSDRASLESLLIELESLG